jgi:CheY-like chemotaxis protein
MDFFNVLVVDDEEDFVETLVNRLNKRKVPTTGVLSGEEAIELMKKREFDVVILDIKMPGGMDGIDYRTCICGDQYRRYEVRGL